MRDRGMVRRGEKLVTRSERLLAAVLFVVLLAVVAVLLLIRRHLTVAVQPAPTTATSTVTVTTTQTIRGVMRGAYATQLCRVLPLVPHR